MEKNVRISLLLDIYGKLLTDKQFQMLDDYYNNDLSLAEVAENAGITRQAVRDNLLKGEKNLEGYENNLELLSKSLQNQKLIEQLQNDIDSIKSEISADNKNLNISKILKNIKNNIQKLEV